MAFGASERLRRLISMRKDLQSRPSTFPPGPRGRSTQKLSKIFRRPVGDGDIPTDLIPEGIVSDGRRVERGQSPPQILCGRFQGVRLSIWIWIIIWEPPGELEKRRLEGYSECGFECVEHEGGGEGPLECVRGRHVVHGAG